MTIYRTIKFRIYPTIVQKELIDLNCELSKKMYNMLLRKHLKLYDEYKEFRDSNKLEKKEAEKLFFSSHKRPAVAKLKKCDKIFKKADSLALEYEEYNVKMSFQKYFYSNNKKPLFKRNSDAFSYTTRNVNNNLRVLKKSIRLPKIGIIKARGFNPSYTNMHVCIARVINEKNGKYYVHMTFSKTEEIVAKKPQISNDTKNVVGLDFKVGSIFTSSDNLIPNYISKYYIYLNQIKELQVHLKRKLHKSKAWFNLINKIRNLHKKISNYRKDFQHKLSTFLCNTYDYIIIETLSLKDIAKKLKNGTNTYDTSYGLFTSKLAYKIKGNLVKINKWFPSSKTCSNCGKIKKKLGLSQRTYHCNKCGLAIDRDLNAAINIKAEGLRMLKQT